MIDGIDNSQIHQSDKMLSDYLTKSFDIMKPRPIKTQRNPSSYVIVLIKIIAFANFYVLWCFQAGFWSEPQPNKTRTKGEAI